MSTDFRCIATILEPILLHRKKQVTYIYLEVESVILFVVMEHNSRWFTFLSSRTINIRSDGHPQVCVQSTKIRFRTGIEQTDAKFRYVTQFVMLNY